MYITPLLTDNGIGAQVFAELTEKDIDGPDLGFTFGGKKILKKVLALVKVWIISLGKTINLWMNTRSLGTSSI